MLLAVDASHLPGVAVVDDDGRVVWERAGEDPRSHAEAIGPFLAAALDAAGRDRVDAVVVGTGPGPFTGLRVGIAAGRAVADALDVPVLPVLSHDGIALAALAAGRAGGFAVVTDAKRRERYWTAYAGADADGLPVREAGPDVAAPDLLPALPHETGPLSPSALALVALLRRRAGRPADPDEPRYLRSPDVTPARSRA